MATYYASINSAYRVKLTATQNSQSVSGNSSVVGWALYVEKTSGSGYWSANSQSYNVKVNGSTVKSGTFTYDFRNTDSKTLASGTTTVGHNSDGSKTVAVSGYAELDFGDATASGSLALDDIPRKSTFTLSSSSVDAGSAVTFSIDRASSSFDHRLRYAFGDKSGTIASDVAGSYSWTVPVSLLTEIASATSGSGTVYVDTYNGSTLLGTNSRSITIKAGSSAVPSISSVTVSETVAAVTSVMGSGVYVQEISIPKAVIAASGYQGSTIKSYKLEVAGQTVSGTSSTQTAAAPIDASGTVAVKATVTDSRGRTATASVNITVRAYDPPQFVTDPLARRATSTAGALSQTGTYIRVDLNAKVSSLVNSTEKNTLKYEMRVRAKGSTTAWDSITPLPTTTLAAGTLAYNSYFTPNQVRAITSSFEVEIRVIDKFNTSYSYLTVSTSAITMDWGENTVGVGKYWERGVLDVGGDIFAQGLITSDLGFGVPIATDCNALIYEGSFQGTAMANAPDTTGLAHVVVQSRGSYIRQEFRRLYTSGDDQDLRVWYRTSTTGGSTWSAWYLADNRDTGYANSMITAGTDFTLHSTSAVRRKNGIISGFMRFTYSGATINGSNGNLAETTVGTIASGWRPPFPRFHFAYSCSATAFGEGYIDSSGNIVLSTLAGGTTSNGSISSGQNIYINFTYFAD